jgi:hypothetical protein
MRLERKTAMQADAFGSSVVQLPGYLMGWLTKCSHSLRQNQRKRGRETDIPLLETV